jgi:hypothetical protein
MSPYNRNGEEIMPEQIAVKQKSEGLKFLRWLNLSRAQEIENRNKEIENYKDLRESIQDAWREWQSALINYENAEGKEMIDYYAYRIKASEIRYEYLLKKAKEARTAANNAHTLTNKSQ